MSFMALIHFAVESANARQPRRRVVRAHQATQLAVREVLPADGNGAAAFSGRRVRYVAILWAALSYDQ